MSAASAPPLSEMTGAPSGPRAGVRAGWPLVLAWGALAALLAVNLPAFLCMGLHTDTANYDLVARRVLAGDVLYRDLLETNFPGVVWLHMAVRSLFGWRSEALRAVDFAVVAAVVWLLTRWLPRGAPGWAKVFTGTVLLAFYLSTSEWCHCQRDTWMLLPALAALGLRARQVGRLTAADSGPARLAAWATLEGVVWAAACWIKPYVAVPALAAWLVAAREAHRPAGFRRLATDFAGLLAGGLAVGAAGVGWLAATGAWPAFVEVMTEWNPEYFGYNVHWSDGGMATVWFAVRFFPWLLVHLFAVPLALAAVWRGGRAGGAVPPLLAGFYLAWLTQAVALQHLFDYIHVPPLMLGMTVLAADALGRAGGRGGLPALALAVACVAWSGSAVLTQPARAWRECVADGSTPAVRDRVTRLHPVNWADLDRVAQFLRSQGVRDGEVTCFSLRTLHLYGELELPPSTRYIMLQDHLEIFASRKGAIHAALADSRQRFVVCDVRRPGMEAFELLDRPGGPPAEYAWADRVAFRAGGYVVYRLDGREMPAWLAAHFGP